jgi:hypothetical protein
MINEGMLYSGYWSPDHTFRSRSLDILEAKINQLAAMGWIAPQEIQHKTGLRWLLGRFVADPFYEARMTSPVPEGSLMCF